MENKLFKDVATYDLNIDDDKITLYDIDGNIKECKILFTFDCDENDRSYIGFTDDSKDEEGRLNIFACYSDIVNEDGSLNDIETEEEIAMVNEVINNILSEVSR